MLYGDCGRRAIVHAANGQAWRGWVPLVSDDRNLPARVSPLWPLGRLWGDIVLISWTFPHRFVIFVISQCYQTRMNMIMANWGQSLLSSRELYALFFCLFYVHRFLTFFLLRSSKPCFDVKLVESKLFFFFTSPRYPWSSLRSWRSLYICMSSYLRHTQDCYIDPPSLLISVF